MGVLLAALSAVLYGSGDFLGGLAAKRELPLAITWYSQMIGLTLISVVAAFVPAASVTAADWGWGAMGGLAGALGLVLLYGALARGPMAVVAPVTALMSAVVPVVAGLVEGERPQPLAVVGVILALPAIALVASAGGIDRRAVDARVLVESVIAGFGFGMFFVFFAAAGEQAGMWPAVGAKLAAVAVLALVVAIGPLRRQLHTSAPAEAVARDTGRLPRIARTSVPLVLGTGAFDVSANAIYLVASRNGLLSLVSVISAMYPASTVALAAVVLRERISRPQAIGLVLAAAAVGLVAAGR